MANEVIMPNSIWLQLSADEFIEAMKGNTIQLDDGRERDFLKKNYIDSSNHTWIEAVVIKDIIVENEIIIGDPYAQSKDIFQHAIIIEGGEFQQNIGIFGGEFRNYLGFLGGKYLNGISIRGGKFQGHIYIFNGNFNEHFSIDGGDFHKGIEIEGGVFQKYFRISNGIFRDLFLIRYGVFEGGFAIYFGKFHKGFSIRNGEFNGSFQISGGEFQERFKISDGKFNKNFAIEGGLFREMLQVIGGVFKENLLLHGGAMEHVKVSNNLGLITTLYISNSDINFFEIDHGKVDILVFDNAITTTSSVYIQNTDLSLLSFTPNFKNFGIFQVSRLHAKIKIQESDPIEDSRLMINSSEMGNATFINTNFHSFDKVILVRCKLSNINTNHGHLPLKTKFPNKIYSDHPDQENYSELAETYNQLQLAMQKQGNRTWAFKYYAEYMEWYRLEQKEKKNWAQYITLSLNKLSTKYGADWIRSFGLILLLGLFFFIAYVLFLPSVEVGLKFLTWPNTVENIIFFSRYYFDFIIPTHKIDFIGEYKAGFWSAFIDVLSRIIIGYLIYQTIAAFRQFGKR